MKIQTLIVEDDPMVSNINEGYLNRLNSFQHIGTVNNGEEALNKIKFTKTNLLLLDIYMPKLNGLELLKKIRSENAKLDVILITAADSPHIIEESMRLGVIDCILKPYDFTRFERALLLYKDRFMMFNSLKTLNQSSIDSLQIIRNKPEYILTLPKGIDPVTLEIIRNKLQQSKSPLTIQQLADQLSISKLTIRKYIEYLAGNNEIKLDLDYSTNGRPSKLYSYKR